MYETLWQKNVRFQVITHPAAGISTEVGHLHDRQPGPRAKATRCESRKADREYVFAILSGDRKLDFRQVAQAEFQADNPGSITNTEENPLFGIFWHRLTSLALEHAPINWSSSNQAGGTPGIFGHLSCCRQIPCKEASV